MSRSRIRVEFEELRRSNEINECTITIENYQGSWTELRAEIEGPPGSPYEGGKFKLKIEVPADYPFAALKVNFLTQIWHPNISLSGAICDGIIKKNWTAAMRLKTILITIQAMLSTANTDDGVEDLIAFQYKRNHKLFLMTARNWTKAYAGGPHAEDELTAKIEILTDMGVNEHDARLHLSLCNWELDQAIANIPT